ncbi:universal stress protein [Priestia flexa]|jgi:nucleotide-binding universal stress UspA family protein|uniref:Universal stress protein n=2 Tax=Priestia TaxID=2800373 RepID=A0A0V8JIX3_9BACI|nr:MULTISPECIES: universal stress protein [Bacillaceae]AQX54268.1 universal stress protein [Priestia flexa]KSU86921.1 universal stress protein [Priestia veravalensis]KZB90801.1 universal stress protein [Bacillus sp. VT 712]MBN8251743.1 universal stress protein [Priestia flexa]MBN8434840.1 universal stress protein [Priestia flexa]
MFKRILLASDGSEHAARAAEKAVALARLTDRSFVQVIYAVEGDSRLNTLGKDEAREKRIQTTQEVLEKSDIEYEITFIHGDAAKTIIQFANNNRFDVVVVGSRGLNPVKEMFLGSVSHKIAQHVKIPVLIVK